MALFLVSRACRRFQPSHFRVVTQSVLFHPIIPPTKPTIVNHDPYYSVPPHSSLINSSKCNYRYIPEFELPQKFNFRDFNSLRLGQNAGISTSHGEEDEEGSKKKSDSEGLKKVNVSWIDLYLPKKVSPYAHLARLDKPIGTWLLAWPCMW